MGVTCSSAFRFMRTLLCSHHSFACSTVERLANERVYTTFVGIGVDFNSEMTKRIATVKACNYLCIASSKEFKKVRCPLTCTSIPDTCSILDDERTV